MTDIHSHILPGVDDGSDSFEESIRMARLAVSGGTERMLVTPHCNIPYMFDNYAGEKLQDRFEALQKAVYKENIPLELYLGAEVYITDDVVELIRAGRINPVNKGRYMLMEFGFGEAPEYMDEMLGRIINEGITPVVAHPERYYVSLDYPEMIYGWIKMGCRIQINKGSLMGRFGREPEAVARVLLGHNLVHCIASDAHTSWVRTPYMADVREYMCDLYNERYADILLGKNPYNILMNTDTVLYGKPVYPDVNIREML